MIYNHFVDVFDRKVGEFGRERMKREVEKLEIENSKLFEKCVNATKYAEQVKNQKTQNPRVEEFILKDGAASICQDHVRKELPVSDQSVQESTHRSVLDSARAFLHDPFCLRDPYARLVRGS